MVYGLMAEYEISISGVHLQDRRNQLLREYAFYNQQYCGCEFSMRIISYEFSAEGKV